MRRTHRQNAHTQASKNLHVYGTRSGLQAHRWYHGCPRSDNFATMAARVPSAHSLDTCSLEGVVIVQDTEPAEGPRHRVAYAVLGTPTEPSAPMGITCRPENQLQAQQVAETRAQLTSGPTYQRGRSRAETIPPASHSAWAGDHTALSEFHRSAGRHAPG
jgi:hypothetical protein